MDSATGRDSATGIDGLLARARQGLARLEPTQAAEAVRRGAVLVDTRPEFQRRADGEIPGAIVVERNHLEWRLDPDSGACIPEAVDRDVAWIIICDEGYSSSLAATSLRDLGLPHATDVIGGFQAWRSAGLPVTGPAISLATPSPEARGSIYLDYNATTPVDPRVVDALLPYLREHFGNPSSGHAYGVEPRAALGRARGQVAALIGARPDEIFFTGSGSEADALAVRGALLAALTDRAERWAPRPPHVITQATEHPAVISACQTLNRFHGIDVTYLPVDSNGLVSPDEFADALTDRTVLATIMHANNETGVVQPIAQLAALAHAAGALFHADAAQTVGKIPVDVAGLGVDLLTLVGHKMYAPKGVAALYVRRGVRIEPLISGGGQERGLRGGTENVALITALGAAADLAAAALATGEPERLAHLRDSLQKRLEGDLPVRFHVNGHPTERLPQTLNLRINGLAGETLLAAVPEIAASTGSACHTGDPTPSPVLRAMAQPEALALGAIRLSLGRWTSHADVHQAAGLLIEAAARLSAAAGAS